MNELIFPVFWKDDQGKIDSRTFAHPFIAVEVSAPGLRKWQSADVMIDTGLSRTSFSPGILSLCGATAHGTVQLSGSQGAQDFSTFRLELRFPSFPLGIIATEGASMDHPLGNTGAGGLLGMDVLRLGRLVIDPTGDSFFSLKPPTQTRPVN